MPNALLFFLHIAAILLFTALAATRGKMGLTLLFCLEVLFANFFLLKEITIFGFLVTATDPFAIGAFLSLALMQERYGKIAASELIKKGLFTLLFFALMGQIHLHYTPSLNDQFHPSFHALLTHTPRVFFSSLIALILSQNTQSFLYQFFKIRLTSLNVSFITSSLIANLIDTICFTLLALYGLFSSLFDVIALSFLIKGICLLTMGPLASYLTSFLPQEAKV